MFIVSNKLAFPTLKGVDLESGRSFVVEGAPGEGACSTRAGSGGFFSELVFWISVCLCCLYILFLIHSLPQR
jgi:hypothetical protein